MKISQQWLKEMIAFQWSAEEFVDRLTMVGLEVEQAEDLAKKFDRFVVGEVLERQKHPNADRLSVCRVRVGAEEKQIVCGAPNVAAGQKVAVALLGAVIPHNQHDPEGKPFVIERVKIRNVESEGMICSAYELGIGEDANGIIVLESTMKPGTPLAEALGMTDIIYEIGITPNRADCLSHIGVAREVAALIGKRASLPKTFVKESKASAKSLASIRILDAEKCPRYCGRVLRGVKIGPSPKWMQDRLTAVGVRPINNVVDVTNYVLMETGHPLHAFDHDRLAGHAIVVRTAAAGESFVTLDGKQRTLTADMLMICDAEKPVAVAGVMGGMNSEISESTTNILLESAYFEPRNIRRTAKALGLSTEASYRFERGADIEMARLAIDRATHLIQQLGGGEVTKGVLDIYPKKRKPLLIKVRTARANAVIGTTLKKSEMTSLLKKIGLVCLAGSGEAFTVNVPSYRSDITEEIDVIEEIARTYGYDNIETKTRAAIDFSTNVRTDRLQTELMSAAIGAGFREVQAISLQDEATMGIAGEKAVQVLNPVSVEMSTLRTSLIPGVLRIVQYNRNRGSKDLRLFEFGSVFRRIMDKDPDSLSAYHQEERMLLVLSGLSQPVSAGILQRKVDLLDMKGEVESLLRPFLLDKYRLIQYDTTNALTEPVVGVEINGTYAGFFGKIRTDIAPRFDLEEDVFVCELALNAIAAGWQRERKFAPLPKFPSVTRDLAVTVDRVLPQEDVAKIIRTSGGSLLTKVTLFDVYEGTQAGEGKKSLAYALEFRASDHTLTDTEADSCMNRIVETVRRECGGQLRA